jgi:phage terminase small subunit
VPNGKLTTKQELFVAAYLGEAHGNATEAARMAGYKTPHPEGSRLLRNPTIAARVSEKLENAGITADAILAELADVGFADWREFVEVLARDKSGKPIKTRMDLSNKVKALELLGKHHQLFADKQIIDMSVRDHRVIGVSQDRLDQMFRPADRADA